LTLLVEPLNARDKPGYLPADSDEAARLIGKVAAPNVRLLFDV